jgi:hypothetical protein
MPNLNDSVGVRFREIMSGPVAAGATDPKQGERAAQGTHQTLRFDLELVIPSLNQFFAASEHVVTIAGGTVRWRGQADRGVVDAGGTVVMYRRDPDRPKRGYFDFRFSFGDNQGAKLEAFGQKVLFADRFLDAGGDLSTVFLTVERAGTVCGAGITRVQVTDLLAQLQSLQVTGASSAVERCEALRRFFGFMNDELRRIYPYFPRLFPVPGASPV